MLTLPPFSTRNVTPFPHPALFRSAERALKGTAGRQLEGDRCIADVRGGNEPRGNERYERARYDEEGGGHCDRRTAMPQAPADRRQIAGHDPAVRGFARWLRLEQIGRHHRRQQPRSEEHTSELQSLMRISYAVFCLKKKKTNTQ